MSDSISRQDAIDALADYIRMVDKVMSTGHLSVEDCKDAAKSVLEGLPSVQFDRDIPKKPREIMDSTWGIHKKQAVCPECDYYLGYVSFLGGRKGKKVTYCEHCGQAIDWEGWIFDE